MELNQISSERKLNESKVMFEYLRDKQPIKIIGHMNTDVDSMISTILLKKILNKLNIESEVIYTDTVYDKKSLDVCKQYGIDYAHFQKDIHPTDNVFLVDHNITNIPCNVVGCIDHHPTKQEYNYELYRNEKSSSCAFILYNIAKELGLDLAEDKNFVELVIMATYLDTISLKSSKVVKEQVTEILQMSDRFDIDVSIPYELGLLGTPEMPLEELAINGSKKYEFNKHRVFTAYAQRKCGLKNISQIINYWGEKLSNKVPYDIVMYMDVKLESSETDVYYITRNSIHKESYDSIVSRGAVLVPKLEEMCMSNQIPFMV